MTGTANISWGKIWVFIGALGAPVLSILFGITIWAVRLDDKLENLFIKVNEVQTNQKEMTYDLKGLHTVVDSIRFSQKLNQAKQEMRDYHDKHN